MSTPTRITRVGFRLLVDAAIKYKDRVHLISDKRYNMAQCGFGRKAQKLAGRPKKLLAKGIEITCLRCLTIHLLSMHRKGLLCGKR